MPEIYSCNYCDYKVKFGKISSILNHLHSKHKISRGSRIDGHTNEFKQYIETIAQNPLCACGCGQKVGIHKRKLKYNLFSPLCVNKGRFLNQACPEFYLFKGLDDVDDIISEIRKSQSKEISEKHKTKLSNCNAGNGNPQSIKSICNRSGLPSDVIKMRLKLKSFGKKNGFYGKKHSDATLEKLAKIRANIPKLVTKPELIMYGILLGNKIDFEFQCAYKRYILDFRIGKTIIEVFGDYWHSDKFLNGRKKQNDDKKIAVLVQDGFNVIVVMESELISRQLNENLTRFIDENKVNY